MRVPAKQTLDASSRERLADFELLGMPSEPAPPTQLRRTLDALP